MTSPPADPWHPSALDAALQEAGFRLAGTAPAEVRVPVTARFDALSDPPDDGDRCPLWIHDDGCVAALAWHHEGQSWVRALGRGGDGFQVETDGQVGGGPPELADLPTWLHAVGVRLLRMERPSIPAARLDRAGLEEIALSDLLARHRERVDAHGGPQRLGGGPEPWTTSVERTQRVLERRMGLAHILGSIGGALVIGGWLGLAVRYLGGAAPWVVAVWLVVASALLRALPEPAGEGAPDEAADPEAAVPQVIGFGGVVVTMGTSLLGASLVVDPWWAPLSLAAGAWIVPIALMPVTWPLQYVLLRALERLPVWPR